MVQGGALKNRK